MKVGLRQIKLETYLRWRLPVRIALGILIVGLLIAGSWMDHGGYFDFGRKNHPRLGNGSKFKVVAVVEPDQIEVDSRTIGTSMKVKLAGLLRPAEETMLLVSRLILGKIVRLHWSNDADPNGLKVWVELSDGTVLNEHVVAAGLAEVDQQIGHDWLRRLSLLQEQARHDRVGMWDGERSGISD